MGKDNSDQINRRSMLKKTAVAGAVVSGFSGSAASETMDFTPEDAKSALENHAASVLDNLQNDGVLNRASVAEFVFEKYDDNVLLSSDREGFAIVNRTFRDGREVQNRLVVRKSLGSNHLNVFVDLDSGSSYAAIRSGLDARDAVTTEAGSTQIVHGDTSVTSSSSTDSVTTSGKVCVDYCSTDDCGRTWANPLDRYNIYYVYDETAGECVMVDGGCCG